jgi:hypothetical protein
MGGRALPLVDHLLVSQPSLIALVPLPLSSALTLTWRWSWRRPSRGEERDWDLSPSDASVRACQDLLLPVVAERLRPGHRERVQASTVLVRAIRHRSGMSLIISVFIIWYPS